MRGRTFSETDAEHSAHIVIINDAMARKYWPKEDPVGQVITIGKGLGPQFDDPPRQIVGVVGSVRETGLREAEVGVMYIPQSQVPEGLTTLANSVIPLSWAVRTRLDPMILRVAVEREFHALDGLLPVARERPMEQVVAESVARQSFTMLLLNLFAAIAVLLAAIGIYGLMSYSVEQRTQEIGIRMALGAGRPHMVKLVLAQGFRLAAAGVILGLAIGYGLTRVLATLLFGVKANDPVTFTWHSLSPALQEERHPACCDRKEQQAADVAAGVPVCGYHVRRKQHHEQAAQDDVRSLKITVTAPKAAPRI